MAKGVAERWVREVAAGMPGFGGAFLHGGVTWLSDAAALPSTSDVDVIVVLDGKPPAVKLGKIVVDGVLLDVTYLPRAAVASAEAVLGAYHLAGTLANAPVIADPSGALSAVQTAVAAGYPRRREVRRRCEGARANVLDGFPRRESDPLPDQVIAWLFPAGVLCHLLLVAAMRNPTVRTRYVATREVLAEYSHLEVYPALLDLLDAWDMAPSRVAGHLDALEAAFDATSGVVRSAFPFAGDLSLAARPIAIDGSRGLIAQGDHREALFWIVATACRCQMVLAVDAPGLIPRHEPAFRALLADLGIVSAGDLARRTAEVAELLPRVWDIGEAIMAANPAIVEG